MTTYIQRWELESEDVNQSHKNADSYSLESPVPMTQALS